MPVRVLPSIALLLATLVALATVSLLASCGGDDDPATATTTETTSATTETDTGTDPAPPPPPAEPPLPPPPPPVQTMRITVTNGTPNGGIVRTSVEKGDRTVLVVSSDVADEVHLHGYDLSRTIRAGGTTRIAFRATIAGRFEVELEERGVPIGELTVTP